MHPLVTGLKMTIITSQLQSNYEHLLWIMLTQVQEIMYYALVSTSIIVSGKCHTRHFDTWRHEITKDKQLEPSIIMNIMRNNSNIDVKQPRNTIVK